MALQLERDPRPLPSMKLNPEVKSIFEFQFSDFLLENGAAIKINNLPTLAMKLGALLSAAGVADAHTIGDSILLARPYATFMPFQA